MKEVARAIILNDAGQVLLGRRNNLGLGKNQWALIGGKPEAGETLAEALVREVKEELGLDFVPSFFKEVFDDKSDPGTVWRTQFFVGKLEGKPKPKADEIIELMFAGPKDLDSLDIAFNHKEILKEFFGSIPDGNSKSQITNPK